MANKRHLTQRDIAQLAGVSQAAVSQILNRSEIGKRIPEETRLRVQKVIAETGYVVDPIARRMAKGRNRILGVFTYEPAFPVEHADFFMPFLFGIEEEAQARNYDLLLLTGNVGVQERKLFAGGNRLRLADACLILGKVFDKEELAQLVRSSFPFMAIGRREDAGGPVPYVGGDYVSATGALVADAYAFGHRRLGYVGPITGAESNTDRWQGVLKALKDDLQLVFQHAEMKSPKTLLGKVMKDHVTALFFSELADAVRFERYAYEQGCYFPQHLSVLVLGSHLRAEASQTIFTSYAIPRSEMGRLAAALLIERLESEDAPSTVAQVLLPCVPIKGSTLGRVPLPPKS